MEFHSLLRICLLFWFIHDDHANFYLHPDIRNWIRNIEQHASDNVNKILVGNKADMDESKRVCSPSLLRVFLLLCAGVSGLCMILCYVIW